MAIQSTFRYAGAKNKMLPILMPYIDKILEGRDSFCDAFVGGGSVLLEAARKYPKIQLFANDKDPWMASFWGIVSDTDNSKLYALLGLLNAKPTIEQFYKLSQTPPSNDLERAYYAVFFNRCCFSGIVKRDEYDRVKSSPIGGENQKSKYSVDCRFNYEEIERKIIACHELLSGRVKVDCQDFSTYDVLMSSDCPIYLDPPYFHKAKMLYNEYMQPAEHGQLAGILQGRSNWVLSYDDQIEIRELYKTNKVIDVSARYCIDGAKQNWKGKNELIIVP